MAGADTPDYPGRAQAFLAAGQLEEAIWTFEAALRDPRLLSYSGLADIEFNLAVLWVRRSTEVTEADRIRRMFDRAIFLLKQSLRRRPEQSDTLLQLANTQFRRFRHTGSADDLLGANFALHELEELLMRAPDRTIEDQLAELRTAMDAHRGLQRRC